ncbi:MAG: hypothetical protein Q8R28_12170, partial [Dehalococcoidia bacterium]|nr:hypothetical protein [Dehalococcoidia bacterium]
MAIGVQPDTPRLATRPSGRIAPSKWLRANLFRTWWDALTTVVFGLAFVGVLVTVVRYLIGADFSILRANLTLFMLGRFPRDQLWRPWVSLMLGAVLIGMMAAFANAAGRRRAMESGFPFREHTITGVIQRLWPLGALVIVLLLLTTTITPALLTLATGLTGVMSYLLFRRSRPGLRQARLVGVLLLGAMVFALAGAGGVGWSGWGGLHLNLFLTISG